MAKFQPLPTHSLNDACLYMYTHKQEIVHFEDKADTVLIKLLELLPNVIHPTTTAVRALEIMKKGQLTSLLVVSRDGYIKGMVTSKDLLGARFTQIMANRGLDREQMTTDLSMTKVEDFAIIDVEDTKYAQVGHVVNTLKQAKTDYGLVVDEAKADKPQIVGIYSLPEISKQLHMDLEDHMQSAETLMELKKRT